MTHPAHMKRFSTWFLAISITALLGGIVLSIAVPQTSYAAAADCSQEFLGFPTWFRGLVDANCNILDPNSAEVGGISNFIWRIVLNIIDIGLRLVGYIAAIFVLYGGFLFLTSNGDPSNAAKARTTLLNAVIGIVISVASIAIVNLVIRFVA